MEAMTFHDVLHRFRVGMGTGTAIMELKLVQELTIVDQEPLFLVFLYLQKAYDNLDCGCLLKSLEGYGAGPKRWVIMAEFWSHQEVVT